ncbi:MAG: hypothetical protein ABR964_02410 [Tepidisphaeraceae bacterium]|jgi:hypothetical protein
MMWRDPSKTIAAVVCCAGLLTIFAVTARRASLGKCATGDETIGLLGAWVQTHDGDFRCNPEDPPLIKFIAVAGTDKTKLPIQEQGALWDLVPSEMIAQCKVAYQALYRTPGVDADALLNAARLRMIGLAVLLGVIIGWWAWRLAGAGAAVVAAGLFSLDPNFLAHSPLLKNDMPMTLALVAVMAAAWLIGERATFWRWAALSLLLGVALTMKFSGVLCVGMIALALGLRALMGRPWQVLRWTARTRGGRLAAAAALWAGAVLIGWASIWASYGFRFSISGQRHQPFDRAAICNIVADREDLLAHGLPRNYTPAQLAQWRPSWQPSVVARTVLWTYDHRLLPEGWLFGFLYTYETSLFRDAFLCGMYSQRGWWYYFPAAFVFKTPMATLAGLVLAAGWWLWRGRKLERCDRWAVCAAAVGPVIYMAVAMAGHLNLGLRHVLEVYPFLFIFAAVMAARAWRAAPRSTVVIVAALLAGLAVETAAAFPDYIPFFNAACGGARGGLRLLGDSNLSWGQDLPLLGRWQREHPEHPVYLIYFGAADPLYYGIKDFRSVFDSTLPDPRLPRPPGSVLALDATTLQGTYQLDRQRPELKRLREQKPIAVIGGSIYLYPY